MAKIFISLYLLMAFAWQSAALTARNSFPLETIYVQTDKQNYFTGETVWFRAFLVNSQTHVQETLSRFVYAELINAQGEVKDRVMIVHDDNGVFAGHFLVTENLEAGSYILRFFTRHLESFGEEYFFQRIIHIITPQSLEENYLSEQPEPTQDDNFVVTFHPEGGDIPVGAYTRVAFKALNPSGLGEDIRGVIVNEQGDTITHIQSVHLGMGSFILRVDRNERFFAIAQNTAGIEKRFELPLAREDAISLQIFRQRGKVAVSLSHDNRRLPRVLYLTLQQRGNIIYSQRWDNNSEVIIIPENDLPTGVIGIILSDLRGVPISKRQIFNTNKTEVVNTIFTTDRETYDTRERVNAIVSITDSENRPLNANFSISVIDNDIAHYDASVNILSTLLLTSNLRGHIENPAYYFMNGNENAKAHLDLVMLTHGWSRFEVNRVYQEEVFTFETSQTITGTLQGGFLQRNYNQSVTLLVPEFSFFDEVYTDNEGRFRFEGFEFPEETEFLLQGRTGTEIQVDEIAYPAVSNLFIPTRTGNILTFDDEQREQIEEFHRLMHDDGIWSMELDEFVVRGLRPRVRNPREHVFSSPFNVRREREDLESFRAPNMRMLLQMVFPAAGIGSWGTANSDPTTNSIMGGGGSGRIANGLSAPTARPGTPPLIFVDGVETVLPLLMTLDAHNVESIEWARTVADRAIFGLGVPESGVIIITTSGHSPARVSATPNVTMITPLGYQITRQFFAPAYTFPEQRANLRADLRTTIFWNPSVTTDENGNANIHFYTSDHVGNYVVVIEGITDEGGIIHTMGRIR